MSESCERARPFGASVEATELRGANVLSGGDRPAWLSPDRCTLYFVSDRTTGVASDDDIRVGEAIAVRHRSPAAGWHSWNSVSGDPGTVQRLIRVGLGS